MQAPDFAHPHALTQAQMREVDFHIDEVTILNIHSLRGEMVPKEEGAPLNFDDKRSFVLRVDRGEIGMKSASLDALMNRYIFGYKGAPLKNLHITMAGAQLRQEGVMHKIVDIPFTMLANVSADNGWIRIHPTKIDICGINGQGLLKAVGQNLQKMLDLSKAVGVKADKNDLLLDPQKILPPPQTELHLTGVRVQGDELVQVFDAGRHLPPLPLPREAKSYMYYRGGTLRMGKLLMMDADMEVLDTDDSDPFDFFIDRYNEELVQGFSRNQADYGLVVYMRDFSDIGMPAKPGEKVAPH